MTNTDLPGAPLFPGFGAFDDSGPQRGQSDGRGRDESFGSGAGLTAREEEGSSARSGADAAVGEAPPRRATRRGSRGGRRRRGKAASEGAEDGDGAEGAEEAEPERGQRQERSTGSSDAKEGGERRTRRPRRRRSGASKEKEAAEAAEEPRDEDGRDAAAAAQEDEDAPKTRRKKSRRRKSSRSRRGEAASDEEDEAPEREAVATTAREEEAAEEGSRKRRRRGTRGGRNRKKKAAQGPADVEFIPGEEDDLPELPDLPDDAELIEPEESASSGRKRTRKKRSRSTSSRGGAKTEAAESEEKDSARRSRKKTAAKSKTSAKDATPAGPPTQIIVNAADSEETRVAVVCENRIVDFQMTVDSEKTLVSDIYRGRVVNIEASIGAAFVDFGRGRNGFLHASDVMPCYGESGWSLDRLLSTHIDPEEWDEAASQPNVAQEIMVDEDDEDGDDDREKKGAKGKGRSKGKGDHRGRSRGRPRLPMPSLLKVGQNVVVQVTKEAIGDKGPTLTTYLSIPGRYLVLMPSMTHTGVSRKIEDAKERKRLKRILDGLPKPQGMGVIARTAAMGHTKKELGRDLDYLLNAWQHLSKRLTAGRGPMALYTESDVAIKTVRDLFGPETDSVLVDDEPTYESIREFAQRLMPEQVDRIKLYDGPRPIFHANGIEQEYEKIFARRLDLPSGGSIVFDQAEALVAIDVNSGKTRSSGYDFEEIALKTNLEAAPEIARQIRLRDMGGILVVDFIDMMKRANMRTVERAFREQFAEDRARSKMGRISQFGLLEMTRQRLGPGMSKKVFSNCPRCRGTGRIRTEASRAAAILRRLGSALSQKGFTRVEVRAHPEVIEYLKKHDAKELAELESRHRREILLTPVADQIEDSVLRYLRADGREVRPGGRRKR